MSVKRSADRIGALKDYLSEEKVKRFSKILLVSPQEKEFYFKYSQLLLIPAKKRRLRQSFDSPVSFREMIHHLAHEELEKHFNKTTMCAELCLAIEIVAKNSELMLIKILDMESRMKLKERRRKIVNLGFQDSEAQQWSGISRKSSPKQFLQNLNQDSLDLIIEMDRWFTRPLVVESSNDLVGFSKRLRYGSVVLSQDYSHGYLASRLRFKNKKLNYKKIKVFLSAAQKFYIDFMNQKVGLFL